MDELTRKALVYKVENVIADYDERELSDTDLEGLNRDELSCISECLQFGQFKTRFCELREEMKEELIKDNRVGRHSLEVFLEIMKKYMG